MVRISTVYDKELKEKVFQVRGDESYARTTDTAITVNTYSNSASNIEGYRIGLSINVYRGIGESSVVVYDNDKVLGVYDWDDEMGSIDIGDSSSGGFLLAWGVDHNIYAKFIGNSTCLPSKTKRESLNYTLPDSFKTEITFQHPNYSINEGSAYTSNITLTVNGSSSSVLYNTDIIIYVDDEYKTTITTPSSSNVKQLSLAGLTKGLHTITAEVMESSSIHGATNTTNVSVGYNIQFTTSPSIVYSGENNTFKASINDYFGTTLNSGTAYLKNTSGTNLLSTTISNNTATYTYTGNSTTYKVTYGGSSSDTLTLPVTNISSGGSISINSDDYIAKGHSLPISILLNDSNGNPVPNKDITVTSPSITTATVKTNSNGIAYYNYNGDANGEVILTATYGSQSQTKTINDYLQYWEMVTTSKGTGAVEYNMDCKFQGGTMTRTSQGYRFSLGDLVFPYNSDMAYFKLEFTTKSDVTLLAGFKAGNTLYPPTMGANSGITIPSGKSVKLEVLNGDNVKLYVDDSLKRDYNYNVSSLTELDFAIRFNYTNYINNVRITKLS